MRVLFATLLMLHVAVALTIDDRFNAFVARHGRRYASEEERNYRRGVFAASMRKAAQLARGNPKATFGDSPFADRTEAEWMASLGRKPSPPATPVGANIEAPLQVTPAAMDWRTKGVVGAIKNQGQCGSCWAFSTIANIESQWALAGHPFVSLSEEQIVACDKLDTACNGGDTISAMQWIIFENGGGVASEAAYPYNPDDNKCRTTPPTARIEGYLNIERNENAMAQWCGTNGPVSICIDANSLQLYTSGILTQCPAKTINHCVAIVGYDTTSATPYWIVRNSWGTDWGERGYFRLEMGHNLCGITSEPLSAMVTRPPPKSNVTFYHCTDAACGSCKATPMEEGQCSDGGLSQSMIAKCSGSAVSVEEFAEEGCDGRRSRNYNATQGSCVSHGAGFYKITCQM